MKIDVDFTALHKVVAQMSIGRVDIHQKQISVEDLEGKAVLKQFIKADSRINTHSAA